MSCDVYRSAAKHQLGLAPVELPTVREGQAPTCTVCGKAALSDHAQSCSIAAGARTSRHDQLVSCWRGLAKRACITTTKEPRMNKIYTNAPTTQERGDICATMPRETVVADISVVHAWGKDAIHSDGAHKTVGAAAQARDAYKRTHYGRKPMAAGYAFAPLSHESSGRLGRPAMAWLGALATHAVSKHNVASSFSKADFISVALKELSVAMCKGNAEVYEAWRTVKVSPGEAVCLGNQIPSYEPEQ